MELEKQLQELKELLTGGSDPARGLIVQLALMRQKMEEWEKGRARLMAFALSAFLTSIGAVLTCVGMLIVSKLN